MILDQGEVAVSLLETKDGEMVVAGYALKKDGFGKKSLQDVYLQAFSKEQGCEGITRKTLSAYLNGLMTESAKDLESVLTQ